MKDGGTGAPFRHPIAWQDAEYTDAAAIDAELRRVFDICHGCRRCFNLCDSFPRLFDLIDESETGELDSVDSAGFAGVVDACTLCDMCFMTKCPYVPPHEYALDFPHLMLRARAAQFQAGKTDFFDRQLTRTDRNGKLAGAAAPLANWASKRSNAATRRLLEGIAGVHRTHAGGRQRWQYGHARLLFVQLLDGRVVGDRGRRRYGGRQFVGRKITL